MRLDNGQTFPTLSATSVGGGKVNLPGDLAGSWGVVLFYRGHWCPYCRQQLVDFQHALADYDKAGIKVVALSVDSETEARKTVDQHHLTFPVAYGVDAKEAADKLGVFTNPEPRFIQASGFVLSPDGRIVQLVYSSGAVGRLVAKDTLGLINYLKSHAG
jgi:peroxiredoxin